MRDAQPPLPKTVSLYLDVVRFASAATVFVYHLSYSGFGGRWIPIDDTGADAVMAFFVLSGLIIAATAAQEPNISAFMGTRLARLWSVVLPALLLTFVLDTFGQAIDPQLYAGSSYGGYLQLLQLAANGAFLNEIWFHSISPMSNLPFWSLGYEFWYYALFAAAFFLRGRKRYLALGGISLLIGPKILLLLPIWLLGVIVFRASRRWTAPKTVGWLMFVAPVPLYVCLKAMHLHPFLDDLTRSVTGPDLFESLTNARSFCWFNLIGILIAVHFLGLFSIQRHLGVLHRAENAVRQLAGRTFSCYLFHFPLFMFFASLLRPAPDSVALNIAIGTLAALVIGTVGPPVEASRHALRPYLTNKVRILFQTNRPPAGPGETGFDSLSAG